MPDRYWVGSAGTWNTTNTTNWSATSGGAGGASAPTSVDNVFFDNNSNQTVTVSGSVSCLTLTTTSAHTGIIQGTGSISVFGNLAIGTSTVWNNTGTVVMSASSGSFTVTTSGKTLSSISFGTAGSTATFTLSGALTCSGNLTVNAGTFNTNNFTVAASVFSSSNGNVRAINLGSSTLTLTASTTAWSTGTIAGLTFNPGTSQINLNSATTVTFNGGGLTFNNVAFTGVRSSVASGGNTITGANTFNNLSITGPSATAVIQTTINAPQRINGVFSTTNTTGNRRIWFSSAIYGLAQTLTINGTPNLLNVDFRDIYVTGTAAPISGTRIGDLRGCRGITFSTPKTVYWNLAGAQNWSANGWASTPTGTPSADNFPLAQDTAAFTNSGTVTGTISFDDAIPYTGTVDMSARTTAMTLGSTSTYFVYGDWKNGSGTSLPSSAAIVFSGRNIQTITSAGKTFGNSISIESYGGTVQLADALNIGSNTLTVSNGTFSTQNFNFTAGALSSSNSNVRVINLGSSTVTLTSASPLTFTTPTNLTFNAGTSSILFSNTATPIINTGGLNFNNVSFSGGSTGIAAVINASAGFSSSFNNLSITPPTSAGIYQVLLSINITVTGTLTCTGATPVRRIFLRSDTLGTPRTLTVNSLSAQDCDFRDIVITGAAAGSSPVRAGDCGGNTGITFPAPKTVYWNFSGTANWSSTAWASSSGGTPDINNFPLAQDTAIFNQAGAASTISLGAAWNIGTLDASARTTQIVFNLSNCQVYGDWRHGSGLQLQAQNADVDFLRNGGTQTITSNGVTFGNNRLRPGAVNGGRVLLADAFTSSGQIQHGGGEFDANGFNVTASGYESTDTVNTRILRMGGGLWTLTGTGSVWSVNPSTTYTLFKSTSDMLFSNTTTSARSFTGGILAYNKLTIGGATGTSTFTFTDSNQFNELASTKTVGHTIDLGTTTQTLGAWTITGTAGNVVTISGFAAQLSIVGARVSGVNYLAMGTTSISSVSPGEFYAGPNSTGTGSGVILTAAPTPVTRYWRGGTGTWDATTTTNWSATSGGAGGASVPTSADAVIFDAASSATSYTVTCTGTQLRCASLTMSGPASGNVTWAGSGPLAIHGNFTLSATGISRSYTANITLSGSVTGRTFTTNGVSLSSPIEVNGVGCGWVLGSALSVANPITITSGAFDTANYAISVPRFSSSTITNPSRSLSLGSSTITASAEGFQNTSDAGINFTVNAGTSQFNISSFAPTFGAFNGNGFTFHNVSFTTTTSPSTISIRGANTFNNLSFTGITSSGLKVLELFANQTINGTLTFSSGTDATMRHFVRSNSIGQTRTLTCANFSGTDVDFRDITVSGAATPVSGTRLSDCKGNSGITFPAPKTVWWISVGSNNWNGSGGTSSWSLTQSGVSSHNAFPLAQDTAIIDNSRLASGSSVTIQASYNIGTIDMSARTSNTMTLDTSSNAPTIYGNWINGTGTTLSGTGQIVFSGRINQTITSAGRTFTNPIGIHSPNGTVTLQDAFVSSSTSAGAITISGGEFNANGYNVTMSSSGGVSTATTLIKTIAIGSGTWTISRASTPWTITTGSNTTVTGTGTIRLTSVSAKTFAGGNISYSGVTLDQGGAGALTISGNNSFANISNSYKSTGATNITLGSTIQRVANFTASGEVGRVLTIQGAITPPATLILTSSGTTVNITNINITGVRAYNLLDTWYATDSINSGSLGWYFVSTAPTSSIYYGAVNITSIYYGSTPVTAIYYGSARVF